MEEMPREQPFLNVTTLELEWNYTVQNSKVIHTEQLKLNELEYCYLQCLARTYICIFIPLAGNFILFSFFSVKNLDPRITKFKKLCPTPSAVKI